jgi:hypothetical protein
VDDTADPGGDGLTWGTAYDDLQDALDVVTPGKPIWVAKGTYWPSQPSGRYATFHLLDGVELYGGFAGTEDPVVFDLDDRDFTANETILNGEIGGSGISDNCYHVVMATGGIDASAVLDGFTVTRGAANGSPPGHPSAGGGIHIDDAGPSIINCRFVDNTALWGGAMVVRYGDDPIIENCTFLGNQATGHNNSWGSGPPWPAGLTSYGQGVS